MYRFVRNSFWAIITQVIARAGLPVAMVVTAPFLDSAQFSQFAYLALSLTMLSIVSGAGFAQLAALYSASDAAGLRKGSTARLLRFAMMIATGVGLLVVTFGAVIDIDDFWQRAALGAATAFSGYLAAQQGALFGAEKYRQVAIVGIAAFALAFIPLLVVLTYFGGVAGAMAAVASFAALRCAGQWKYAADYMANVGSNELARVVKRSDINAAAVVFYISFLSAVVPWTVGKIMRASVDLQLFSAYVIGFQWYGIVLLVPSQLAQVAFPGFVKSLSDIVGPPAPMQLAKAAIVSVSTALVLVGAVVVMDSSLRLFYAQHLDGSTLLIWPIAAVASASALVNVLYLWYMAQGRLHSWAILTTLWATILVLLIVLVPVRSTLDIAGIWFVAEMVRIIVSGLFLWLDHAR